MFSMAWASGAGSARGCSQQGNKGKRGKQLVRPVDGASAASQSNPGNCWRACKILLEWSDRSPGQRMGVRRTMSKEDQLRRVLDGGIVAIVRSPDSAQLVD